MRRKLLLIGIIFISLLFLSSSAYCGDNAIKKLGRGVCNIATCPLEIPGQISKANQFDGPMAGLTYGLLKGILMTGVRATVGAYEVLTFPIPFPRYYSPILKDPEFFFEDKNW